MLYFLQIETLDLSWCELITDAGIAYLVESCPNLKSLNLRQCAASTLTMTALQSNASGLTHLGVSSVQGICQAFMAFVYLVVFYPAHQTRII